MDRFEEYVRHIDAALEELLRPRGTDYDGLLEAERYSLTAPGKRIRPMLVLEFARVCGAPYEEAMPAACAVEMLHTYSLIHDDLPCMDNDELRRGRPTNHRVFGECNAVLAGDALQADAFSVLLNSAMPAPRRAECAGLLARAAGSSGMCAGQYLDTNPDVLGSLTGEKLRRVHALKTGALLQAACLMGCAAAGASPEQRAAAAAYGAALGLAFQIRDDLLDRTATTGTLGKTAGSDERDGKTTFVTLLGAGRCEELIHELTETAKASLGAFADAEFLCRLAERMSGRAY